MEQKDNYLTPELDIIRLEADPVINSKLTGPDDGEIVVGP